MTPTPCPSEAVLLSFVDTALSPEELSRVERHLPGCSACMAKVETLQALIAGIAAPVGAARHASTLDVPAHVSTVMQRLDVQMPISTRPKQGVWAAGILGLAAAAALLFVQLPVPRDPDGGEWTARGGAAAGSLSRDVGVELYERETSPRVLKTGGHVRASAAFTAGLRNLSQRPAYVLLFAVDAKQTVHWIAPQFLDPSSDPASLPIAPTSVERMLPSAVVFDDLAPGPLRIVAMVTEAPLRVSAIERLTAAELGTDLLRKRLPQADMREVRLVVEP